ncbi:MAG: hypothetical protein ACFFD4_37860 [Candidatus Odinarchaeota archaeon]
MEVASNCTGAVTGPSAGNPLSYDLHSLFKILLCFTDILKNRIKLAELRTTQTGIVIQFFEFVQKDPYLTIEGIREEQRVNQQFH